MEYVTRTPLPSMNKAAHSDFETQRRRHQKSKTWVSVALQKGLLSSKIFFKKTFFTIVILICALASVGLELFFIIPMSLKYTFCKTLLMFSSPILNLSYN